MNDTLWFLIFASWPIGCGGLLLAFAKYLKPALTRRVWLQLVTGNALVLLFLGSLVFLGGEIYYHFLHDESDSFNYTKSSARWGARHWRANAQDFRDDVNCELQIPAGKRRISFLGDSFTAGHGVKNVGDRFANRIRAANPKWDVQVLAYGGWDTPAEVEFMERVIGAGAQLDQVVLIYCLNDISDLVPEWPAVLARIFDDSLSQNWLVRNSYFASTVFYRWKARRDPDMASYYHFVVSAYGGPIWDEQKNQLSALRDLVESKGGHLLVVTFPFLHAPLDDTYEYRFVHQRLAEFWRGLKVPHLDLLTVYEGLPPRKLVVNRFDAHPSEFAHKLAAEAIQKFLNENISPQPAPTTTNGRE
jgi:hypothetical protein